MFGAVAVEVTLLKVAIGFASIELVLVSLLPLKTPGTLCFSKVF